MKEELLVQLTQWHKDGAYDQIIAALEGHAQLDDLLIGHLARAYNNRGEQGDYDRAIERLLSIRAHTENDPIWHLRLGYSYYHANREEEAAEQFEQVLALVPDNADAKAMLAQCRRILAGQNDFCPICYTDEEMDAVEAHIEQYFGTCQSVFHEIASPDIHLDICIIPPTQARDYYTLVTMGMGAHQMNVPEELRESKLDRAELAIRLPRDWKVLDLPVGEDADTEIWYWPIRCLKLLARLPSNEDTWLGWGHTIDNEYPYAENTALSAAMLISVQCEQEEANVCVLPDGDEINFYQIIPLYQEEMTYKLENSAEALFEKVEGDIIVVDPARPNFCAGLES